jgi:hypothetical protein
MKQTEIPIQAFGNRNWISIVSLTLQSPMTRKQLPTLKNPNNQATPPGLCTLVKQADVVQTASSILMPNSLQVQLTNSCMAV